MKQYLDLLQDVLDNGVPTDDRTGVGTLSVFGRQTRYDLREGFPLLTTKKVFWRGVVAELLWFLQGDTNNKTLTDQNVHIWDAWAPKSGDLGHIYGKQWREWEVCRGEDIWEDLDQIASVVNNIKEHPNSRRHIVSAWNVGDLEDMVLPPCHLLFQFYVRNETLSCQLYQRSGDILLGVPFNIASYALLTHMVAASCGLKVGEFIHTIGDAHLYKNHIDQAKLQLSREPRELPQLQKLVAKPYPFDYTKEDIVLTGYDPWPSIKAEVAV